MGASVGKSMFEQALDALPDGVLLIGADRKVVYSNPAFATHWRIPARIVAAGDDGILLSFVRDHVADPVAFLNEVERISPTRESSQDEVLLRDGRMLARRSVPFEADGALAARLWIFTDVTEASLARTDFLCGIANRRAYSSDFPAFFGEVGERSVGIIDVDNFKAYNDLYGHAAGDLVLQRVADLLRHRSAGAGDMVFRIGGEEFLVACRLGEPREASDFFETIRAGVAALALPHAGNTPHGRITVSIGLGTFRGPQDAASVFDQVDAALYRAKRGGRNRVEQVARIHPAA